MNPMEPKEYWQRSCMFIIEIKHRFPIYSITSLIRYPFDTWYSFKTSVSPFLVPHLSFQISIENQKFRYDFYIWYALINWDHSMGDSAMQNLRHTIMASKVYSIVRSLNSRLTSKFWQNLKKCQITFSCARNPLHPRKYLLYLYLENEYIICTMYTAILFCFKSRILISIIIRDKCF